MLLIPWFNLFAFESFPVCVAFFLLTKINQLLRTDTLFIYADAQGENTPRSPGMVSAAWASTPIGGLCWGTLIAPIQQLNLRYRTFVTAFLLLAPANAPSSPLRPTVAQCSGYSAGVEPREWNLCLVSKLICISVS